MSWLLLALAGLLLWLGIDMLAMSRKSAPLPQMETDKQVFGEPPVHVSEASRLYAEQNFLVKSGASTQILGALLVLFGLVCLAFSLGWHWQCAGSG